MTVSITLRAVGIVRSAVTEIDNREDWSEVECDIVVDDDLAAGLRGVADYSHLMVVFYLHKFRFDPAVHLQQPPSNRVGAAPVGIFALRTPLRPNAIGATTVRLLSVEGNVLRVKGLDALDGSPVLDIKPPAPPVMKVHLEVPDVEPNI